MEKFRVLKHSVTLVLAFLVIGCSSDQREPTVIVADDGSYEIFFTKDGVRDSLYQSFDRNKVMMVEAYYQNGLKHGYCAYFDSLGVLTQKDEFSEGELVRATLYSVNGDVVIDHGIRNSLRNGSYFQMNSDGDTIVFATYINDSIQYVKTIDFASKNVVEFSAYYEIEVIEDRTDSLVFELYYPSPDPYLEWSFSVGEFDLVTVHPKDVRSRNVPLEKLETNRAKVTISKRSIVGDKIQGLIIEHSKERVPVVLTTVEKDIL